MSDSDAQKPSTSKTPATKGDRKKKRNRSQSDNKEEFESKSPRKESDEASDADKTGDREKQKRGEEGNHDSNPQSCSVDDPTTSKIRRRSQDTSQDVAIKRHGKDDDEDDDDDDDDDEEEDDDDDDEDDGDEEENGEKEDPPVLPTMLCSSYHSQEEKEKATELYKIFTRLDQPLVYQFCNDLWRYLSHPEHRIVHLVKEPEVVPPIKSRLKKKFKQIIEAMDQQNQKIFASTEESILSCEGSGIQGSTSAGSVSADSNIQGSISADSNIQGSTSAGSNIQGSTSAGSAFADYNIQGSASADSNIQGSTSAGPTSAGSGIQGSTSADSKIQGSTSAGSNIQGSTSAGSNIQGSTSAGSSIQGTTSAGSSIQVSTSAGSNIQVSTSAGSNIQGSISLGSTYAGSNIQGFISAGSSCAGSTCADSSVQGSIPAGSSMAVSARTGSDIAGSTESAGCSLEQIEKCLSEPEPSNTVKPNHHHHHQQQQSSPKSESDNQKKKITLKQLCGDLLASSKACLDILCFVLETAIVHHSTICGVNMKWLKNCVIIILVTLTNYAECSDAIRKVVLRNCSLLSALKKPLKWKFCENKKLEAFQQNVVIGCITLLYHLAGGEVHIDIPNKEVHMSLLNVPAITQIATMLMVKIMSSRSIRLGKFDNRRIKAIMDDLYTPRTSKFFLHNVRQAVAEVVRKLAENEKVKKYFNQHREWLQTLGITQLREGGRSK